MSHLRGPAHLQRLCNIVVENHRAPRLIGCKQEVPPHRRQFPLWTVDNLPVCLSVRTFASVRVVVNLVRVRMCTAAACRKQQAGTAGAEDKSVPSARPLQLRPARGHFSQASQCNRATDPCLLQSTCAQLDVCTLGVGNVTHEHRKQKSLLCFEQLMFPLSSSSRAEYAGARISAGVSSTSPSSNIVTALKY